MTDPSKQINYLGSDEPFAVSLKTAIHRRGWRVARVADWSEAVDSVRRRSCDALFMDWPPPNRARKDGILGLDNLPVPTVLLPDSEEPVVGRDLIAMGAQDYLIRDKRQNWTKLLPYVLDNLFEQKQDPEISEAAMDVRVLDWAPTAALMVSSNRIVYINAAASRMTGYQAAAVLGQSAAMLFPNQHGQHLREWLTTLDDAHEGRVGTIVSTLVRADGSMLECGIEACRQKSETGDVHFLVLRDRTESMSLLRELEEANLELRHLVKDRMGQIEDLREAGRKLSNRASKTEMASAVLHNVKNVLSSLVVSVNMLDRLAAEDRAGKIEQVAGLLEEEGDDLRAFLTETEKGRMVPRFLRRLGEMMQRDRRNLAYEVGRLTRNIEHINASIQTQMNRVRGGMQCIKPSDLFEQATDMVRGNDQFPRVSIHQHPGLDQPIQTDQHKVLQILINLMTNALQATGDHDQPELTLRAEYEDAQVNLSVRDNGCGMDEETLAALFSFGFTTKDQGHGIGLHGCRRLAKECEGNLIAQSDGPGQGAVFTLTLPRSKVV